MELHPDRPHLAVQAVAAAGETQARGAIVQSLSARRAARSHARRTDETESSPPCLASLSLASCPGLLSTACAPSTTLSCGRSVCRHRRRTCAHTPRRPPGSSASSPTGSTPPSFARARSSSRSPTTRSATTTSTSTPPPRGGSRIGNTPDVLTDATADLDVRAAARRRAQAARRRSHSVYAGDWLTWEPARYLGASTCAARRSGSSDSGGSVAPSHARAQGFDMHVIHADTRGGRRRSTRRAARRI